MNAKKLLNRFLSEEDYENIGKAVVTGYKACDQFMESHVAMSDFIVGMEHRSRLVSVFVEHSLMNLDGFTYEIKPNAANNCHHTRFYKNKLAITAHFLGRGTPRKMPKQAYSRAQLSERNFSLFDDEGDIPDISADFGYCWLQHCGFITPRNIELAIPSRDQRNIYAITTLPITDVEQSSVEIIREEMAIQILAKGQEKKSAS